MQGLNAATDEQLLTVIRSTQDVACFEVLFARYRSTLRRFIARLEYGNPDIDDIVQETFLRAFVRIGQFNFQSRFSTWLCRIAYNEYLQTKRKQSAWERLRGHFSLFQYKDNAGADIFDQSRDAFQSLRQLSKPELLVIVHCDMLDYSHSEAASLLDLPVGSVKTYLARARKKAREYFDPEVST